MRELPEKQNTTTFAVFLGRELRRYRLDADLPQDDVARQVNYTGAFIGMVETAKRSCPRDLAERADQLFATRGALPRLWEQVNEEPHPAWFQPFVRAEAEAASISEFEPLVISGLLQTEDYANEVIRAGRPEATDEQIKHEVTARMSRRGILDRAKPPRLWLVLDESALRRVIGSPAVMHEALAAVLDAAARPRVTVQVLPYSAGAHAALGGPLTLLGTAQQAAYCEGHATARLITDPEEVAECAHAFSLLQSAALPVSASLDFIRAAMEGYRS